MRGSVVQAAFCPAASDSWHLMTGMSLKQLAAGVPRKLKAAAAAAAAAGDSIGMVDTSGAP